MTQFYLPTHLRVTVGLAEENERFVAALEEVLARLPPVEDAAVLVGTETADDEHRGRFDLGKKSPTEIRPPPTGYNGRDAFLQFRIDGRAGNNFAVTQFMENLESSQFLRDVRLNSTDQIVDPAEHAAC